MREQIEKLMAKVRQQQEEAGARAERARTSLISLAMDTEIETCDPDKIRAAADDLAAQLQAMRHAAEVQQELRRILF